MKCFHFVVLTFVASLVAFSTCQSVKNGLGEDCTVDADCTVTVTFSYCNTTAGVNKCACLPEYVQGNNTVVPVPELTCFLKATELDKPNSCEISAQCVHFGNSTCDTMQCVCRSGSLSSTDKKKCLTANVIIGQHCEEDKQCVGPNSGCTSSKVCACNVGYVSNSNNTQCLQVVNDLLTTECLEPIQCHRGSPGPWSDCIVSPAGSTTKVCNCTSLAIAVNSTCYLIPVEVENACQTDQQCEVGLGESYCSSNGQCLCKAGFVPSTNRDKCLLQVKLDDSCVDSTQCSTVNNAQCVLNASNPTDGQRCRCNTNYVGDGGECYPLTTVIGGLCSRDSQCVNLGATCNTTTCQCSGTDVENASKTKCLPLRPNLNDTCDQTAQCQVNNSVCVLPPGQTTGLQCQCQLDVYVESNVTDNTCVPIRHELNEKCEENLQCVAGIGNLSECADGVCQCKRTYGYFNGSCYIPSALGQVCHQHEDCYLGVNQYAFCSNGTGTTDARCRCQPGTLELNRKCYQPKLIGHSCVFNEECTVSIQGEVQCDATTKICTCRLGYSPDAGNTVCASGTMLQYQFSLSLCVIMLVMRLLSTS
ncbi:Prion-like-(Q/N-rich) domain-bearing protein 25 [Orchesella cincta]|uniref:Prion-like-(Q/N-rich) domain-bearing protein 25 n=1 Tax=Orchesella cincta TaxID=48709 RepID=A0A1D2MUG3_ORCCI|nr:Prion-like-(Q/N-rich) domain-bearing protein 25 [Orchesella cincta]